FSLTDVSVIPSTLCYGVYTPRHKYLVKINGAYSSEPTPALPSFGFQCSVVGWHKGSDRFHDFPPPVRRGSPAGYSWNPFTKNTPVQVDTFLAGGAYCIENIATLTNHGASSAPSSWEASFYWQAPDTAIADTIGFWYILCAVDSDGTSANDVTFLGPRDGVTFVNTATTTVHKVFSNVSFTTFPNPVIDQLYIRMNNLETGAYDVNIFDMSARKIYSQNLRITNSSYTASINAANWPSGIYQVQFIKDGDQHIISVVKQ
ncbi:MAG: T9SS type A sorting domain-containing protein, partial [Flavipsychrobacter sp.]